MKYNTKSRKCLQDWIEANNLSVLRFTKLIGGVYQNVRLWVRGNSRPSYTYALTIQKYTEGAVTVQGWSELCEPAKQPKNQHHQPNTTKNHDRALKPKRRSESRKQVA